MGYVGRRVLRVEDAKLLSGRGKYVADVQRPGMVHAAVLRSPVAHAGIRALDYQAARSRPGVLDVISFQDIASVSPIPMRLASHPELSRALQRPLASDRVRYVGEPVAVAVADTRYHAEDALESIDVDYELLPTVGSGLDAIDSPTAVHEAVPDNVAGRIGQEVGDVARGLAEADYILEATLSVQRHSGVPLETRGLVAEWDTGAERLTVWGAAKVVHFNRLVLSQLIGLPESRIHLIEVEVGGGFGIRGEFYPEDYLIPLLAMRLRRPVAWVEDRAEHLVSANHSREQVHRIRVGVDNEGRILALDDEFINDMGAYIRTHGATVPTMTVAYLPGPYRIPNYRCVGVCTLSNKTPTGTYRAPGRFEASFVRERLLDMIAEKLALDPAEVRRRNFVSSDEMPYDVGTSAHGTPVIYDSGDYRRQLESALAVFNYDGLRAECQQLRAAGRAVGIGIGAFVEKSGLGPWEYARVEVDGSGLVILYTGAASLGQGIVTILTQIVADQLSVGIDGVRVVYGDTDLVPYGGGAFASRATVIAGSAAHEAAGAVRERLLGIAADLFEVDPQDLVVDAGAISVRGVPDRSASYRELVAEAGPTRALPRGQKVGVSEESFFQADLMTYPYGVHLGMVEVDRETGGLRILKYLVAYDVGRAINPLLVEGQLIGAFAQGLGGTLLEHLAYGADGQPLAASFVDYLIPTAAEIPPLELLLTEDAPAPRNPLGVKGAGEGGANPVGATLANAVCNALGPPAHIDALPISPQQLQLLASGRASHAAWSWRARDLAAAR